MSEKPAIPHDLDVMAKTVLTYRPLEKQKATKRREKRKRQRDAKKG
jgi:hypothetical protein